MVVVVEPVVLMMVVVVGGGDNFGGVDGDDYHGSGGAGYGDASGQTPFSPPYGYINTFPLSVRGLWWVKNKRYNMSMPFPRGTSVFAYVGEGVLVWDGVLKT